MKDHNYPVYILKCADDSYYTGVTNDIERRLKEHKNQFNQNCYTASRLPLELVLLKISNTLIRPLILKNN
jgi:putative endonuclease